MFEKKDFDKYMKDSEDYYDNREPLTERKLYQLWKDGAEFGYNKVNEELGFVKKDKVAELEQENTELKEAIKHFNPCCEWDDDVHDCEFRHYAIEYGSKLTKAKEIIKEFMRISTASVEEYEPEFTELIGKAKQLLEEFEAKRRVK